MQLNRMPRKAEARKRRASGAVASMDRGEASGLRGGAKRQFGTPLPPRIPRPPPLYRAGVVGILCAGGFPARAAPGARIIPNSPPRRAEARKAGRPAARGTAVKNFLKKVLDTVPSAQGSIQSCAKREREAHGGPQAPPGTLRTGYCGWNFTKPDRASGEFAPKRSYGP